MKLQLDLKCRSLAVYLVLSNPSLGCLYEMHRYICIIEIFATVFVVLIIIQSISNTCYSSITTIRHRYLEIVFTIIPAALVLCIINLIVLGLETVEESIPVALTLQVTGFQ